MAMTEDEIQELEETFRLFDKDANGRLSVEEAGKLWRSIAPTCNPTQSEIQEMFDMIDKDGSGSIDCKEFLSWVSANGKKEEDPVAVMRDAFKVFDRDGNGYITRAELKRIMTELGEDPLSSDEIDALMRNFDDDGDGRINYEEFIGLAFSVHNYMDGNDGDMFNEDENGY